SEHQEKLVRHYRERYHWPLALACVLLVIEMLFPERKREPRTKELAQPSMKLTQAAALISLLLWPATLLSSTSGALRDYKEGKYDSALKEYQKLLQRNTNDARLHFNT